MPNFRHNQVTQFDAVLLFSGGRDSTLAAVRLSRRVHSLGLVTVAADHLSGLDPVVNRLSELAPLLDCYAEWLLVQQPDLAVSDRLPAKSCLPCQSRYLAAGVAVAHMHSARAIGFGYTRYQSDWPEQRPEAVAITRAALSARGMRLELPVLELSSKDEATSALLELGLTGGSMEQKCALAQFNARHLDWASAEAHWRDTVEFAVQQGARLAINIHDRKVVSTGKSKELTG